MKPFHQIISIIKDRNFHPHVLQIYISRDVRYNTPPVSNCAGPLSKKTSSPHHPWQKVFSPSTGLNLNYSLQLCLCWLCVNSVGREFHIVIHSRMSRLAYPIGGGRKNITNIKERKFDLLFKMGIVMEFQSFS